ncbi:hypothetical protein BX266_5586 [Streptomyces sp. TLI_171]|nr:hypothetical protein BX266_5586 [Streptomyces sp. TLI_171]
MLRGERSWSAPGRTWLGRRWPGRTGRRHGVPRRRRPLPGCSRPRVLRPTAPPAARGRSAILSCRARPGRHPGRARSPPAPSPPAPDPRAPRPRVPSLRVRTPGVSSSTASSCRGPRLRPAEAARGAPGAVTCSPRPRPTVSWPRSTAQTPQPAPPCGSRPPVRTHPPLAPPRWSWVRVACRRRRDPGMRRMRRWGRVGRWGRRPLSGPGWRGRFPPRRRGRFRSGGMFRSPALAVPVVWMAGRLGFLLVWRPWWGCSSGRGWGRSGMPRGCGGVCGRWRGLFVRSGFLSRRMPSCVLSWSGLC